MVRHAWPAEREREIVFLHFEDGAAHVGGVGGQEFIDVSPVDRDATVVTPIAADRIGPPEITPIQRVAPVVPEVRPVVRGLDPQPIQFFEIRIATRSKLAMHIAQPSKADFTGHEDFGHVAHDGCAVPFEYRPKQLEMSSIAGRIDRSAFPHLTRNERLQQQFQPVPRSHEPEPELIFSEAFQRFIESAKRFPYVTANRKGRRNASRVGEDRRRAETLRDPVQFP